MILVNNAGACGFCYEPFHHVKWNGFNPADLVFPMFMFVMGISIYLSLSKTDFDWHRSIVKVVKRALLLIAVGIALKWVLNSMESGNWLDFANMRIMGVLQRLGICYGSRRFDVALRAASPVCLDCIRRCLLFI
jgi:predicted acyltransferase